MDLYWTPPGGTEVGLVAPTYILQQGWDGFDSPPAQQYSTKAPYQNGTTALGASYEPRSLSFSLSMQGASLADLAALKRATTHLFVPDRGVGVLRWVQDDGTSWVLRCRPARAPEYGTRGDSGRWQAVYIDLIADDPFWYSATLNQVTIAAYGGGWEFPLTFPLDLGTAGGVAVCTNSGDVAAPVTITLAGPVLRPVLRNVTTGEWWGSMSLVPAGKELVIAMANGEKRVVVHDPATGTETDALADVLLTSDWFDLQPGENRIAFGNSVDAHAATMTVAWYDRFLGA